MNFMGWKQASTQISRVWLLQGTVLLSPFLAAAKGVFDSSLPICRSGAAALRETVRNGFSQSAPQRSGACWIQLDPSTTLLFGISHQLWIAGKLGVVCYYGSTISVFEILPQPVVGEAFGVPWSISWVSYTSFVAVPHQLCWDCLVEEFPHEQETGLRLQLLMCSRTASWLH